MFLASALKRGRHPPENIMKFQGGECLSLGHLLRTWPPAISVKTTLRFSHRSETSVCTYSVVLRHVMYTIMDRHYMTMKERLGASLYLNGPWLCVICKMKITKYIYGSNALHNKSTSCFAVFHKTKRRYFSPYTPTTTHFLHNKKMKTTLTDGKILYYDLNKIKAKQQIPWILKLKGCY